MQNPDIHHLRRRLSPKEASAWEYKLLGMQRRGHLKECQRPGAKQRRLNVQFKCELKHYVLAPTFRYCPGCITYRNSLSHYKSLEKRRAKEGIIAGFEQSNLAVLARDKKSLLDQNEKLTRDGLEMSSIIEKLRQDKIENAASVQRWNEAMQRELIKSGRLTDEVSQTRGEVATLTARLLQAQELHRALSSQPIPPHQAHGTVMLNNNAYHQEAYYFPEAAAQYHQGNPPDNSPYQQHF